MIHLAAGSVKMAVLGGALLGGGGGGSMDLGLAFGNLAVAMDRVCLVQPDELPGDAVIVTVGAVGAPAAQDRYVTPRHYVRAVDLLCRHEGIRVGGLITNENGGFATVNGWLQAATLNVPVVDAPCNGRAHPTGLMGSMGLHRLEHFVSVQCASGGDPKKGRYLETTVTGSLSQVAAVIRQISVQAGGIVAVARNPVSLEYVQENAAPGAITQAMKVGKALVENEGDPDRMAAKAMETLGGSVLATGIIEDFSLMTEGGFDLGSVRLSTGHHLTFWNEYMTLDTENERVATFPDLIMTLDAGSGLPLATADLSLGRRVILVMSRRENLFLGGGMRDPGLFAMAEAAVGKPMVEYVF
ncbi:MAG: DUF917 family protein [Bacillota bacterium]